MLRALCLLSCHAVWHGLLKLAAAGQGLLDGVAGKAGVKAQPAGAALCVSQDCGPRQPCNQRVAVMHHQAVACGEGVVSGWATLATCLAAPLPSLSALCSALKLITGKQMAGRQAQWLAQRLAHSA
jgi:hypothetical protein